jgi:glycosyltransferase involved in cell wall biosynthesis
MNSPSIKPLVLHLAVDYPNAYRPENTLAVRNFVQANTELDYLVIALTRTANPLSAAQVGGDGHGDMRVISMRYWGFPFGLLLALSMFIVALRVRREVKRRGLAPVLVHAHKLTFEGLAGWWLSRWLKAPLVLSVRGEAESKILRFKPHYRPLLQRILLDASRIYYVSAWFKPILNARFKIAPDKQRLLPNFVMARPYIASQVVPRPDSLLTVLDLNVYRKKGLDRLLPAFRDCLGQFPQAHLDIIGRGAPAVIAEVQQLIESLGIGANVSLLGPMPNSELQSRMPTYVGMALPSHNETFGMVYVEALLAGVPILHSKGTGIDGFIDFVEARATVNPLDQSNIHAGLMEILIRQDEFHKWIVCNREKVESEFNQSTYIAEYSSLILCRHLIKYHKYA